MDRRTPPSLRLTRQWTQPTTFEHQSLSRVAYPSPLDLSPSLSPSPRSNGGGSGARPAWPSPAVSSTAASPLPSRPSPLPQEHRTPRRKAPVPVTAGAARTAPVVVFSPPASRGQQQQQARGDVDEGGQYFWQQQARRLEEANVALRAELQAVYHVVSDKRGVACEGEKRSYHGTSTRIPDAQRREAPVNGSYVDEQRFAAVVTERNVARMELAQERELNFLLRHRLREMEIALEQAEQRSFHRNNGSGGAAHERRVPHVSRSGNGASTRVESADTAAMKPKRSAAGMSPPHRLPASRTASSYSASTASSSSRASSRASSSVSPRHNSSPRTRSVTRRRASHQGGNSSNSRERTEGRGGSSLPKSTASSHHSGASRLSRGYERLRRRAEARVRPHTLSASTASSASVPPPAMSVRSSSSPLPPEQGTFTREASSTSQQQQQHQPPRSNGYGRTREMDGRALLSSLLSAHPAAPPPAGSTEQQRELVARREEPQPRHTFRSRLFSNAEEEEKEAEAAGSAVMPLGEEERSPPSDPSAASLAASYVVHRRTSPASVALRRTSPYGADSISDVLAQRPSRSASWLSVSLTTEDGNPSRSLSLREKLHENTAWSAAFRSFSL